VAALIEKFAFPLLCAAFTLQPVGAENLTVEDIGGWRSLVTLPPSKRTKVPSVITFALSGGTRASLIIFRPADIRVAPALANSVTKNITATTAAIALDKNALLAVNGGYFNLSNGESTSYVVLDGVVCADPHTNRALTENLRLKPFLPQIYNRSELRFLKKKGSRGGATTLKIACHDEPVPDGMELSASLQAGPRLLPQLTAEAEAFVRTEAGGQKVDSIGVGRTAARTAIGLTNDGYMLILTVAGKGQDEFSSGLNLADLATLLKNLGATEALNLDGGTSTTMVQFNKTSRQYDLLIGRKTQTRVRSAIVVGENTQSER